VIKFTALLQNGGNLYGFGLSEANLNRLEFNDEPIFFDFGYAGHPELFGLILYFGEFEEPAEIAANADAVNDHCIPFIDEKRGVTAETLRVFPIAKRIMRELRGTPLWSFQAKIHITNPSDMQMFLSGRTEHELEQYFLEKGLISPQTKRTYKGFGKREL
jgi:hypothetical protein